MVRGKVALPCNIEPPAKDDEVVLVLWYKDETPAPIFTLDARKGNLDRAKQAALSELGSRAYFNMANRPAFLQLDPVQESDAGEYRCRVDFKKARSINTVINLRVIGKLRLGSNRFSERRAVNVSADHLAELSTQTSNQFSAGFFEPIFRQ